MPNKFLFFVLSLFLLSCSPHYEKFTSYQATTSHPTILPDDKSGIIYFYKPYKFAKSVSYCIYEGSINSANVAVVDSGTYSIVRATPGIHTYVAHVAKDKSITINIDANKTYYVKCGNAAGMFLKVPKFDITSKEEFEKEKPNLVYLQKK